MKRTSLILLLALISCQSTPIHVEAPTLGATKIVVSLPPGPHFQNWGWWGPFPFLKGPQWALWATDLDGHPLGTLMVTDKSANQKWIGAEQRPESLPVWSHSRAGFPDIDAIAAASQGSPGATATWAGKLPASFQLFLEVNLSYDWNATWKQNLDPLDTFANGVNGQPSLVYRAVVRDASVPGEVGFELVGHGSARGTDGEIHPDLTGFDTAKEIFGTLAVRIE
jgi:hypothetical protein